MSRESSAQDGLIGLALPCARMHALAGEPDERFLELGRFARSCCDEGKRSSALLLCARTVSVRVNNFMTDPLRTNAFGAPIGSAPSRGGKVVLISDAKGLEDAGDGCLATIEMPVVHPLIAPLVYAIPVQLLAYHVAVAKGTDVDQPRNLAKSVTVE